MVDLNRRLTWEELGAKRIGNKLLLSEKKMKVAYENMPLEFRGMNNHLVFLLRKHTGIPEDDAEFLIMTMPIFYAVLSLRGLSSYEFVELWDHEIKNRLSGDNAFSLFMEFVDRLNAGEFDRRC